MALQIFGGSGKAGGGSGSSVVMKRGVTIPTGALDVWKAARDAAATTRTEVAIFGDSTTQGSGATRSWVTYLRDYAVSKGMVDGGRGLVGVNETAAFSGENLSGILTNTGFGGGGSFDPFLGNTLMSNASGNTITFQGKGTHARILYTRGPNSGPFTYSVDGGTSTEAATVNGTDIAGSLYLTLGADPAVTHTIAITNPGGAAISGPGWTGGLSLSSPGATGFSSGTFYYVATAVTASGESTPGAALNITVPNGPRTVTMNVTNQSAVSYKIYRSTTGTAGSYQLIGTVAQAGGSYTGFTDDNSATPGAAPPTVSAAGRDTSKMRVAVVAEFMKPTGVVFHNGGVSGISWGSYFGSSNAGLGNAPAQVQLGLVPGTGSGSPAGSYGWQQPPGAKPATRAVSLAIGVMGINDLSVATPDVEVEVENFIRMARAAGADPLVVIPHIDYGPTATHTGAGRLRRQMAAVALGHSAALADFNEALGPNGAPTAGRSIYTGGPHLNDAAYQREGQWLWDNVLSL